MKVQMNEKFQSWIRQGVKGKQNYEIVIPYKEKYVLRSDGFNENLRVLSIFIMENGKIVFRNQWKKEEQEENFSMALVIRKQRQMMIYDGEETVYGFGMENEDGNNEQAMVYYQSDITGTLVMASNMCSKVHMLSYVLDNPQADAVAEIMGRIWEATEAGMDKKDMEVNNG